MVGCGGGGGESGSPPPPPPPPAATYTVGGTVSGLAGSGLTLAICIPSATLTGKCSSANAYLAIGASGSFTFNRQVPDGNAFNVWIKNQPTSSLAENCQVANGTGTIAAANVTNVYVTCVSGYTVGGTASGLVGSGLTLGICSVMPDHGPGGIRCHDLKQVGANGAFTLDFVYPAGTSCCDYVVIAQQPSSPTQNCLISNTTVSIQNANDTAVTVSCAGVFLRHQCRGQYALVL